jgi:hypothetical protein
MWVGMFQWVVVMVAAMVVVGDPLLTVLTVLVGVVAMVLVGEAIGPTVADLITALMQVTMRRLWFMLLRQ